MEISPILFQLQIPEKSKACYAGCGAHQEYVSEDTKKSAHAKIGVKLPNIPVVGSSANMTDGLAINSQATDKRFFSPPLIPRTFASPTMESAQLTLKRKKRNSQ